MTHKLYRPLLIAPDFTLSYLKDILIFLTEILTPDACSLVKLLWTFITSFLRQPREQNLDSPTISRCNQVWTKLIVSHKQVHSGP